MFLTNYPDVLAIEGLSGTTGLLRKTAANTWSLDTSTFLTANQSITSTGDASGTGTTAITVAISANTVTGKALTGYSVGSNTTLSDTDSILIAFGKVQGQLNNKQASGSYQTLNSILTSISSLSTATTGLIKLTNGTASLDATSYLVANQTITLSGDASGSGTTAITVSVNGIKGASVPALSTGYLRYTGTVWEFKNETYSLSSHNHSSTYQPLDPDLTAIAGLTGTTGFLKKTAADTWTLDTNSYLTGN